MPTKTLPDDDQQLYDDKFWEMVSPDNLEKSGTHPTEPPLEEREQEAAGDNEPRNWGSGANFLRNAERSPSPGLHAKIGDKNASPQDQKPDANFLRNAGQRDGENLYSKALNKNAPFLNFIKKRKRLAASSAAGTVVVVVVVVMSTQTQPLLINHLAELIKGGIGALQDDHAWRYRRRYIHRLGDLFTRDGRRAGKVVAEMMSVGYQFRFDDTGRMVGMTTPAGRPISSDPQSLAEEMDRFLEWRHPLRTSKWKAGRMESFYRRYQVARLSEAARRNGDPNSPKYATNKRIAQEIFPKENIQVRATGQVPPESATSQEERTKLERQNNVNEQLAFGDGSFNGIRQKLLDGVPIEELSPDEQLLLKVDTPTSDVMNVVERTTQGSVAGRLFGAIRGFVYSGDILDQICTVKNRLAAVVLAGRYHRALGLLKYAAIFVKLADKTRAPTLTPGDLDPNMVNEIMSRVTAADNRGNFIGESAGMSNLTNGWFSKSANDALRGNVNVDGKLSGVLGAVNEGTRDLPGTGERACGVWQNPGFQIGAVVVELGLGFISGGSYTVSSFATKTAITTAVKDAVKSTLNRQFAKQLARNVTRDIAFNLTFEGALALMQIHAEKAFALNFTGQERGGELGEIVAAGSGVLHKQRGLMAGMVPATASQYQSALDEFDKNRAALRETQSFYTRVLDYNNPDSLAFKTMTKIALLPWNVSGMTVMIGDGIGKVAHMLSSPLSFFSGISNLLPGRVMAADGDRIRFDTLDINGRKMAIDTAGNLLTIMREDIASIDPVENINHLVESGDIDPVSYAPKSPEFRGHLENCVEQVDTISIIERKHREEPTNPQYDCLADLPDTKRYKALLAFADMTDVFDSSFFPEEIALSPDSADANPYFANLAPSSPSGSAFVSTTLSKSGSTP